MNNREPVNNNVKMIVPEIFKNQLIGAILSSPIIYIPHHHYNFIDSALASVFPKNDDTVSYSVLGLTQDTIFEYDKIRCQVDFETKTKLRGGSDKLLQDVLKTIINGGEFKVNNVTVDRKIFYFKNIVEELQRQTETLVLLQTIVEKYERGELDKNTTIILVDPTPVPMLPTPLSEISTIINVPLPSPSDIQRIVADLKVASYLKDRESVLKEDFSRHLQGLQFHEIDQIIRSSLEKVNGFLSPRMIDYALEEKKQIIKKSGIIEVVDTDITFKQVGGLEVLIEDLERKSILYHNLSELHKLRLPLPKGVLIMGMPGCGKSMIAKAIASSFEVSLLRLDISKLMGQYVGQSEENLRRALATAEAAHPCVLWIDEIEKAFAGANASGNDGDMLVQRMMGYFLTWMQERKTAVYIVATANDVMRPEFMRKGRFDEVYFVDFPTFSERIAIFRKSMSQFLREDLNEVFDFSKFTEEDQKSVVARMDQFSGAEIVSVINSVIERRYVDYIRQRDKKYSTAVRPVTITKDMFIEAINEVAPSIMSKQTSGDEHNKTAIEKIRELQKTFHFKSASKVENFK